MAAERTLDTRALNRALLDRQLLLRRQRVSPVRAIERLVGLQAQATLPPYLALLARLDGFEAGQLDRLLISRRAVRIAAMRSTVHLLTADDALALRTLAQPVTERELYGNATYAAIRQVDAGALIDAVRPFVDAQPRTNAEIGAFLSEQWPDVDRRTLAHAVRCLLPMAQVPPRGILGQGGQVRTTPVDTWVGRPLHPQPSWDAVVPRYLAAFGPATVADAQKWSTITGLADVFERLRPGLRTFRDERGRELFDVPRGRLPRPDTPAPVRFLGEYDNVLLSHADRTRIVDEEVRRGLASGPNGAFACGVLIDGFVGASWRLDTDAPGRPELRVELLRDVSPDHRADLESEGERLLGFLAPDAERSRVRIVGR